MESAWEHRGAVLSRESSCPERNDELTSPSRGKVEIGVCDGPKHASGQVRQSRTLPRRWWVRRAPSQEAFNEFVVNFRAPKELFESNPTLVILILLRGR